jgi:diguanylate cyclase (GGDEF)-like protein
VKEKLYYIYRSGSLNPLSKSTKWGLLLLSFLLVTLVGVVDYLTGVQISISLLYLFPIALVSWLVGRRAGIFISLTAALDWFVVSFISLHNYSHPAIPYWNAAMELCVFLIFTLTLSGLKDKLMCEEVLARIDPLTGIANRRTFLEQLEREINRIYRYQHSFSLAYLDLDNFKLVNDKLGHHTGDRLLNCVAETINHNTRLTDLVARLGGDEFAILLPETSAKAAENVLNKIKEKLQNEMHKQQWPVTASIGLATFVNTSYSVNEVINIVDTLMYNAKKAGKGLIQCQVFTNLEEFPELEKV